MRYANKLFFIIFSLFLSFVFFAGCNSDTIVDPGNIVSVAPPTSVDLLVDAIPGGSSYALITWNASVDESQSDFKGYRITTYALNSSNVITSTKKNELVPKTSHTNQVNSIQAGTRYISYIVSELNDGTKSDSVATKIYGGVFFNTDGVIDEFSTTNTNAESGYGWNVSAGAGTQYAFTSGNSAAIDVHMRFLGVLKFYSPNKYLTGGKSTLFGVVGTGQDAFNETTLDEPTFSEVDVVNGQVYLIKTQENNYIKIWVKGIVQNGGIYTVTFDYKVQPIVNLRLVKK